MTVCTDEIRYVALDSIFVGTRKRPIDTNAVREIAQSIERQGLLQPIGVKPADDDMEQAWKLVFGAHRLSAYVLLKRGAIEARILEDGLSDEEYLLIELEENSARHDLTKGQRKDYAAEVGRLLSKLAAMSDRANGTEKWFVDFIQKTNVPRHTAYNWWHAFCAETDRSITPKQALDEDCDAFFDWLQEQRQKEEAEDQRKKDEAAEKRRHQDFADALENLAILAADYGREAVIAEVIDVFLAQE